MSAILLRLAGATLMVLGVAQGALAQVEPIEQQEVEINFDSGRIVSDQFVWGSIFSTVIRVPRASWLRLQFDRATLGITPRGGKETFLRLTSMEDGAQQHLNLQHLNEWQYTSAYFNGDAVKLEIIADPGAGPSRISIPRVWAGPESILLERSICGPTDDRELSDDPRVCRVMPIACTGWLINDANHCFLTAGHCVNHSFEVMEFNVPLSDSDGNMNHPPPSDQYVRDPASLQTNGGQGIGNDWAYFGCFANTETNLTPYEAQGECFELALPPAVGGQSIRITGYGTVGQPVSPTWNRVQKTHVGPFVDSSETVVGYQADTTGGNSGSPVINEDTGEAIGIHTHGGCNAGQNNGTGLNHPDLQDALAHPQGVCIPLPPLEFHYPYGFPEFFSPNGWTIRVKVTGREDTEPEPGTGVFHYDLGGGMISVPMDQVSPNVYEAHLPETECGSYVAFFFTAETTHGEVAYEPSSAPLVPYSHIAARGRCFLVDLDLEDDPGWSTQGSWSFGQPMGSGGEYGGPDPESGYTGSKVYGYNLTGDYENSMPQRHLTSHLIDCSDMVAVKVRFQRWLGVEDSSYDHAFFKVSGDGDNWSTVWENGEEVSDTAWQLMEFDISSIAAGEDEVTLRWTMGGTDGALRYCGWNLDDIQVIGFHCEGTGHSGDLNGDGVVDINDIFVVLGLWGPCSDPPAECLGDLTGDGIVNLDDIFYVLGQWT